MICIRRQRLVHWMLAGHLMLMPTLFSPQVLAQSASAEVQEQEPEKGPHRGRMLRQDNFAIELAIFETGVPPEFRIWATQDGVTLAPEDVDITVELVRLGGVVDRIRFAAEGDYLRGDTEIYEPHSFEVRLSASYGGQRYEWRYDNFEGRTRISDDVAAAMNIETGIAGPGTLVLTTPLYGRLNWPAGAERTVRGRFDGEIRSVPVVLGQSVKRGQTLATIESNDSLRTYAVRSPMDGVISDLQAAVGEFSDGQPLMVVTDTSRIQAELAVYPKDQLKVRSGAAVALSIAGHPTPIKAQIGRADARVRDDQARIYRVSIANPDGHFLAGQFVSAEVESERIQAPLVVKRDGLQAFRDFTVVYAKVGEEYEVRMLELGEAAGDWVEVLGGLVPGTEYVTRNSYIIKADIDKSGASHDH